MRDRLNFDRTREPILRLDHVQRTALARLNEAVSNKTIGFKSHSCPLCGNVDTEHMITLATRDRYGVFCPTVTCNVCGMTQTNPYLDEQSTNWFYSNIFAPLHRGHSSPQIERFQARRRYAANIVQWLKEHGVPSAGTMVDVGCGAGGALQGFVDSGFKGIGVEIDPDAVEFGRQQGLDTRLGNIANTNLPSQIDLVTYIHVLEHIADINGELDRLANLLPVGALVYIEVPGMTSVPSQYYNDVLRLIQLAHIWHFTPVTLKAMMTKKGFLCLHIDEAVRGIFKFDPDAASRQDVAYEDPKEVCAALDRLEVKRILYWRTWATTVKRLIKPNKD